MKKLRERNDLLMFISFREKENNFIYRFVSLELMSGKFSSVYMRADEFEEHDR
jgi:hypothetical protein